MRKYKFGKTNFLFKIKKKIFFNPQNMLKKIISLILCLIILFTWLSTKQSYACSLDISYYEMTFDDFYDDSDIIFIWKVADIKNTQTSTSVIFEISTQYKWDFWEKQIEIFRNDYTTCEFDSFLSELKKDEIYTILSFKQAENSYSENKGKYTIVSDNRFNQKFDSVKKAKKFIQESCKKCSEQQKQDPEIIPEKKWIIEKVTNWIKSFFKN